MGRYKLKELVEVFKHVHEKEKTMSRIPHGHLAAFDATIQSSGAAHNLNAPPASPTPSQGDSPHPTFDTMFSEPFELWGDPGNLLPEGEETVLNLKRLGRAMCEGSASQPADSIIPSLYTYFGQFLAHEITFEEKSDVIAKLHDPNLAPLSPEIIRAKLLNLRTPRLDLDCIYGQSVEENARLRDGKRMRLGKVIAVGQRPAGKVGNDYDLPRNQSSPDSKEGGVAIIGDPRNDENLIVSQLHVALLRAHNELV